MIECRRAWQPRIEELSGELAAPDDPHVLAGSRLHHGAVHGGGRTSPQANRMSAPGTPMSPSGNSHSSESSGVAMKPSRLDAV